MAPCSLQASRVSTFRKGDKGLGKNIQSRGNFCEQYIPLIVSLELEQQQQGAARTPPGKGWHLPTSPNSQMEAEHPGLVPMLAAGCLVLKHMDLFLVLLINFLTPAHS